ncbi:sulfur carrier protein ThiS [Agrobacterium larrymoorei]|uniref:Sulfur carrier protein ThiS n=1 Tax=Agrobacterium larrymoorei TaxID=160699 RepID=A0A4D7DLT6_9HYPH|nr:sulfur carrier protein ThiS [Agrobacterium larrymoorei]QCI96888.1 sulfur carrier protein ThiS [Agrobacterium larrymoorei]QYA07686.1 sulfur carrier protein ThiS [Agrobacterium larrymoorei]
MRIHVNGEEHDLTTATLSELLSVLDYEGDWLATAVNGDLVHAEDRPDFHLKAFDRIEILSPMQGG